MWKVTTGYIRGILTFIVEHETTRERKGFFDNKERAQELADELNREGV